MENLEQNFVGLNEAERKNFYYSARDRFNSITLEPGVTDIEKAALFIFLNKTCFNGLYRVNKQGQFNVPAGIYKKPLICDQSNLIKTSEKLQNVNILCGDYYALLPFVDDKTFLYLDPPYRPLTKTSSFTSYSKASFGDNEQIKLADFVKVSSEKGAKFLLSNSDPHNNNSADDFFDLLYSEFNIKRVSASRMINSNASKRGKINELLISNY